MLFSSGQLRCGDVVCPDMEAGIGKATLCDRNTSSAFDDGVCASTCAIAAEFLRLQGGVKFIAIRGHPFQGPIQGVGGIKGVQSFSFSSIWSYTRYAAQLGGTPEQKAALAKYTDLPICRSAPAGVNTRDAILPENGNNGVPGSHTLGRLPSPHRKIPSCQSKSTYVGMHETWNKIQRPVEVRDALTKGIWKE